MSEKITDSNFNDVIAQNALAVIEFGATWCGPCRMMAPIIDELATAYAGKAFIGNADVEECPDATELYAIVVCPPFCFLKTANCYPINLSEQRKKKFWRTKLTLWCKPTEILLSHF
ncbi:MAG TPA: thioredoxin domain-containing protein [Paludibacteraceae bacterium]|nr:thioredoxin domain-containing protein [Paludibacteraceae bacterium]